MTRRIFNTTCDVFQGPGGVIPGDFVGTFPCRLVPQLAIEPTGVGSILMGYWLTIDGYPPRGAWTPYGFGMDDRLSDQIAVPSGSAPRFWCVYTDLIVWHALTPYYRSYLSSLPLPPPAYPRLNGDIILGVGHPHGETRIELEGGALTGRNIRMSSSVHRGCITLRGITYNQGRIVLGSGHRHTEPRLKFVAPRAAGGNVKFTTQCIAPKNVVFCMPKIGSPRLKWRFVVDLPPPGISVLQVCHAGASGTSCSPTWANPTTAGSTLIALASCTTNTNQFTTPTLTWPSGYTNKVQTHNNYADSSIACKLGAASESGAKTISNSWSAGQNYIDGWLIELGGTTGFYGSGNSGSGGPTTGPLGMGTMMTTTAAAYMVGLMSAGCPASLNTVFSSPSSGFTLETQYANNYTTPFNIGMAGGYVDQILSATGTYSPTLSMNNSGLYAGVSAWFY